MLSKEYKKCREKSLGGLWIQHKDIQHLFNKLNKTVFIKKILGYSENSIPIHSIGIGKGRIKIFVWSQMHGDEATVTKSIFDILNFISNEYNSNKKISKLLTTGKLVFIPMLNPDGSNVYIRENTKGIDIINRDAIKLKSSEARILTQVAKAFKPDFTFNLNDQEKIYNVIGTNNPVTLSFLSPPADAANKLTKSRKKVKKVIVAMYNALQKDLHEMIGRYDDTYNSMCFGDTLQKKKIATILIEAGYYKDDKEGEIVRKFHFIALINALFEISNPSNQDYLRYFDIPLTEKRYYDVLYKNVKHSEKLVSLGVRYRNKVNNGKLIKIIDDSQVIMGEEVKSQIFYKIIDYKGKDISLLNLGIN